MSTPPLHAALKDTQGPLAFDYLGVLDFEATCAEGEEQPTWDPALQEIIELPVTLVHVATRQVVDQFVTVVRPTQQPLLTDFCRTLTHITQAEVDAAPHIGQAISYLSAWLDAHQVNAHNTLLVTCGDWDLRRMWPRQVSLSPLLETPRLFQRWCNLKVIFSAHTQHPATGMMGMLKALELPHHGHHHRGADDVVNLTNIVLRLLTEGATFGCTWDDANRQAEFEHWLEKLKKAQVTVENQERAVARMLAAAPADALRRAQDRLHAVRAHAERTQLAARAFQLPSSAP